MTADWLCAVVGASIRLSSPSALCGGLFYAVGFWNAFFNVFLYFNDTSKWPVQAILRTYVLQGKSLSADQLRVEPLPKPQSLQMAVALVYPVLQRRFAKGVITGAVKG